MGLLSLLEPLLLPGGGYEFRIGWAVFGLFVGSFLNVAIHRFPLEGESVSHPRRSRCPSCKTTLTWKENVPLLSWLVQRGKCRTCGWRIPVRYPLVELLTALLWWLAASRWDASASGWTVELGLCVVRTIVLSGLVVATFVDFDCFEIPDEVSIGGIVLAPIAALLIPALHDDTRLALWMTPDHVAPVTRFASFTACLAGMAAGGGILWLIGWVGSRIYGRDAMGFGDVKLLAAGGGFLGPGGVLWALMIGSLAASVVGVLNLFRFFVLLRRRARARGRRGGSWRSLKVARVAGRYVPFGPYLALGIGLVLLYWEEVAGLLRYGWPPL
jgi:leader peptidase (prepilin peptidase) / N-methyltransferase